MPPNLGGFFMVRSYYPSECHADYFDFERIEALKPAIEACGISTLSQSPMLGFHRSEERRVGKERRSGRPPCECEKKKPHRGSAAESTQRRPRSRRSRPGMCAGESVSDLD